MADKGLRFREALYFKESEECSGCGAEITFTPGCNWVSVVYPGMKSGLKI
jgi:hypothetical protein